jgi:hypothetical protein
MELHGVRWGMEHGMRPGIWLALFQYDWHFKPYCKQDEMMLDA